MNSRFLKSSVLAGCAAVLSGCVDNDYDLSNIDTTSRITIDNLRLPVNIDAITLSDIFDIDEDSKIQVVDVNGTEFYAVTQKGDINSQSIDIPAFTGYPSPIAETNATFELNIPETNKRASLPSLEFTYNLQDFDPQPINVTASGIDESVREIHMLESKPMTFNVTLRETDLPDYIDLRFDRLELEILKGLQLESLAPEYSYDPVSGILTITDLDCPDKKITLSLTATGIDFTKTDPRVTDGSISCTGEVRLISGVLRTTVNLDEAGNSFSPSQHVNFNVKTTIAPFEATHFTGKIEYRLTGNGLDIAPVTLNDIPDFLNQEGTDLKLANPQIYLNLNNPVANYNLYYQTGLELVSVRGDEKTPYSPDGGKLIATEALNPGPYNFVLSPANPANPLDQYASRLQHIPFSGLSDVLSGEGLPEQIEINLLNPELPLQTVNRFELGKPIDGISGSYDFIAPVALKSGSTIIYGDTKDGWNDEDIDKIIISTLEIEADVTSTIPLDATLTAYPLMTGGSKIPGVKASGYIPANAKGEHIIIRMEGTIEHLDGITFEAVLNPDTDDALAPSQTIRLENLRARISGSYTTEF
ncbi:MAG: hypothetical protein K2O56_09520 [Muribaculaceae bacterium]|nr:hypothetical protein [Muribaculaceae bacterium]